MDHRDMRGDTIEMMVGREFSIEKSFFTKRTQLKNAYLSLYEVVRRNWSWVRSAKNEPRNGNKALEMGTGRVVLGMNEAKFPPPSPAPDGIEMGLMYCRPQRLPGGLEVGFDDAPVLFGDVSGGGSGVVNLHGLGAVLSVFDQLLGRDAIEFRRGFRHGAREVFIAALGAVAMDNPPFQFQPGGPPHVEGSIADVVDLLEVALQIGQRALVVGAIMPVFEDERGFGGVGGDVIRPEKREMELEAHQFSELEKQVARPSFVVRAPHQGVEVRNLPGGKPADIRATRDQQVAANPQQQRRENGENQPEYAF